MICIVISCIHGEPKSNGQIKSNNPEYHYKLRMGS